MTGEAKVAMHENPPLADAIQGCERGRAACQEEALRILKETKNTLLAHPLLTSPEEFVNSGGVIHLGPNTILPRKGSGDGHLFRPYTRTVKPAAILTRVSISPNGCDIQEGHFPRREYPVELF